MEPEEFVSRFQSCSLDERKKALPKILESQVKTRGNHLDWASLCEELSLFDYAFREVQLAVRDEPDNGEARFRLAQYLMEKGELPRAATHLEKVLSLEPTHRESIELLIEIYSLEGRTDRLESLKEQAHLLGFSLSISQEAPLSASENPPELLVPTEQEAVRFLYFFSGREDVYARQWCSQDGKSGYTPVRAPLTPKEVLNHFLGNVTLGVYPIRLDNTVKFMAIDLDIRKSALHNARTNPELAKDIRHQIKETAQKIVFSFSEYQFTAILEDSGYKGRHLWILFETPQNAEFVFLFGKLFLAQITPLLPPNLSTEFFPKQPSRSGKGLGNLIKLPLGIHRKTGRRSFFLEANEQPISDWVSLLATTPKATSQALFQAIKKLKTTTVQSQQPSLEEDLSEPAEKEPLPPPPPVPPLWTEAHFETDAEIAHLLAHCPVLAELKKRAEKHQTLSRDEKIVLIHSLGHSASGVQAVNYLFSLCANIPPEAS